MEAPAAVALLSGIITYTDLATPGGRPLRAQDTVGPGASLDVHKGSHVSLQFPNGTVLDLNENTQATMVTDHKAKMSRGGMDVKTKHESAPSFEGVNVSQDSKFSTETPDGTLNDFDTWYKVSVSDRGSSFEMLEGSARLTGASLARTDANFNIEGKPALTQSLDLKTGDHAFAFHIPSWAASGAPPATAPPSPLDRPDPWNNPQVQQFIDEWLHSATPPIASPGPWRYSDWGVGVGPGTTIAGPPDHPAGWSRYQTVWSVRNEAHVGQSVRSGRVRRAPDRRQEPGRVRDRRSKYDCASIVDHDSKQTTSRDRQCSALHGNPSGNSNRRSFGHSSGSSGARAATARGSISESAATHTSACGPQFGRYWSTTFRSASSSTPGESPGHLVLHLPGHQQTPGNTDTPQRAVQVDLHRPTRESSGTGRARQDARTQLRSR